MKKEYFYFSHQFLHFNKKRSYRFVFCMLMMLLNNFETRAQILWSTAAGQAWLLNTNWTGNIVPNTTDIAQFGTAPTSGVTGVGINMNGATNNGANNQAVGAIEILSIRPVGMLIGNSSTSVNGTLTLNGATVNAINNVILRNNSSNIFIIEDQQALNVIQTLTVALNNSTDNIINIDGTGGIAISSVISGASKKITLSGSGNGILALTAANTYTGLTTVSSNTLQLNKAGGGTLPATNDVLINGTGKLKISSNQTIHDFTMTGGTLVIDAGIKLTITGAYNVSGGTINNLGTIKLNGGAISFPGTGVTINNGFAGTMTSLEIASTGNITQTAPFTIDNQLTLTSGILISNAANHITCSPGILVTGVSNTSFVDGPVSKIGNSLFTFPIGKMNCGPSGTVKGYVALEISNFTGGAATDKFTAEYKRGSAYALGTISAAGLDHISRCDYWTLTRDIGTAKVDIRLYWDEPINNCIFTAPYINNLLSLIMARYNSVGATWDAIGVNGITSGNTTTGSLYWGNFQSTLYTAFAIGSINFLNPLPITINYFTGIKQNGNHLLNWKVTCNSSPNVTISLERSSDSRNYNSIYTIPATTLRCQQPFDYTDNQPAAGINYYRLKITDANGKISYSSMVSLINADKGFDITNIAPNPVEQDIAKINISAATNMKIEINISDLQGRIVQKQIIHAVAGFNSIPINVSNLATGTYQLAGYSASERSKIIRFFIQ